MAKSFNFNNVAKKYLNVTLPGEKAALLLCTPSIGMVKRFIALNVEDIDESSDNFADVIKLFADLLSNNKTGRKITNKEIENNFDLDDLFAFYEAYADFIGEIQKIKN